VSKFAGIVLSVFAATIAAVALAHAQTFPDHPIKVIVAYPPGGPTDTVARILTQGIARQLGKSMIVENVAGAGGRMGTRDVARAAPDGYTLLLGGTNDNAITPVLYKSLDYDPAKDFVPVSAVATDSNAIVVHPSVPVHTLAELTSYTKANPGKLTSGATLGIAPHLMLEFIKVRTGADMVFVPYKGAAPAIADVLGNHIQVNASAKSVLLPLIKDGRLRALAVSSAERWPELPDVPTLRESGLDGFPTAVWFVMMAPAATPPDVITKLNEAINLHILSDDCREAIRRIGLEPHVLAPDVLAKVIADETQLWQGVARETGVHLE
jgi:tripartite-type tricarboxylate transporter receptor subunit TctC